MLFTTDRPVCSTDGLIPCVMPFLYQGKYYENCIDIDNGGVPWCYTNVEKKVWGICDMSTCQRSQGTLCTTKIITLQQISSI